MFVALLTPFAGFKDIVREKLTIMVSMFLKNSYNNLKIIKQVE